MARNTKEEAIETRNRILDAAENVFHAQGVARTTLADVAQAANVTRGAIYWHFKNKGDLFEAMCERVNLPLEAILDAREDKRQADPLAHLRYLFQLVLSETTNNPHSRKVFDIMLHKCELVDPQEPVFMRQKECYMEGNRDIEQILQEAVAAGQLPPDLDIELARVTVHAVLVGLLNNWLLMPESFDLARVGGPVIDACMDTLRHAVSLRKPH